MCNRYKPPAMHKIKWAWRIDNRRPNAWRDTVLFPRGRSPFIRRGPDAHTRELVVCQWGLVPIFANTTHLPNATNNARDEELATKANYKQVWARGQRCVIPVADLDEPFCESGGNMWWRCRRQDRQPWGLAALWNPWIDHDSGEVFESYRMLTINADQHPVMRRIYKPNPNLPPDQQEKRSVINGFNREGLRIEIDTSLPAVRVMRTLSESVTPRGAPLSYEFRSRYPTNDAPLLALLLTRVVPNTPRPMELGCRTAVPPYDYPHLRIATDDVAPIVRASWFRGVSSLPNSFAHDCFIDELAFGAGADPLAFRLAHLPDARARELLQAVADRFGWNTRQSGSAGRTDSSGWVRGCGLGYARYVHSNFPGFGAAFAAWAVELSCHPATGRIVIKRVVVGQDAGLMVNPDGVRHQVHGNVVQILSRVLKEEVRFDTSGVAVRDWGAYPLITFTELPAIELVLMDRPSEPPLGAGESTSVPAPAAIANALFDATGVRFFRAPFTPERVRGELARSSNAARS